MRLIIKACVLMTFGLAALGIVSPHELYAAETELQNDNPNLTNHENLQNGDEVNSTTGFTPLYEIVTTPSSWSTPAKVLVGVAMGGGITYAYMKYMNNKESSTNTESQILAELIKINKGIRGIDRSISSLQHAPTGRLIDIS